MISEEEKERMDTRTSKEEVQKQGGKIPGRLVARLSTFYTLVLNTFGLIISVFSCHAKI
jgi:hypothetical protein